MKSLILLVFFSAFLAGNWSSYFDYLKPARPDEGGRGSNAEELATISEANALHEQLPYGQATAITASPEFQPVVEAEAANKFSEKKKGVTVYLFLHEDCLVSQYYTVTLKELAKEFSSEEIAFQGIFPNESSTELGMLVFAEKYGVDFPLQQDEGSELANTFGATITPEVVVYDEDQEVILYQGRIDNAYQRIGRRRRVVTEHELKEVLESIRANEPVTTIPAAAVGCFIERRN